VEPGALAPVSLAAETGLHITPEAFLDHLAPAFARYDAQLTTNGFGPIRTAWLSHAARLGQEITARLPNDVIIGTFRDIDADGTLILDTAQGRRPIAAAEISF
jgi:BirA family biotin operon repressor/biotin-[acetyl-CoA-carboxylase] ligase